MNHPHSAHGIYTPLEILEGRDHWLDVKKVIADAKKERVEANKFARCENYRISNLEHPPAFRDNWLFHRYLDF